MNLALDPKLTGQLMTCGKDVFLTLIDLNEKVNAEFFAKPFTRLAFEQMLVAMGGFLAEMFPESDIPAITGTYCVDTGVVDLPNLLPVIEKLVTDNQGLQPIKVKDSKMRNHKHFGTPQDTSFIGDIVRFIAEHGGLKDWEKDLLINRITAPISGEDSLEVLRAKEGLSQPVAHEPADMPTPNSSTSAEVARMTDTTEPLTMSITRDDDGHMCIAISDRKWKICRPGIIGITEKDRLDFNAAAHKLSGCGLPFSDDIEVTLPYGRQSYLEGKESEYKRLLKSRGTDDTSLGQIAYECFRSSGEVLGAESAPPWSDIPKDGPVCAAWEFLGRACYYSVGTWPDDTEKTIQILATRKRLQLLRETGRFGIKDGTEFALFLNLVAGPPSDRKA